MDTDTCTSGCHQFVAKIKASIFCSEEAAELAILYSSTSEVHSPMHINLKPVWRNITLVAKFFGIV